MKHIILVALVSIMAVGCGTFSKKEVSIHEQTIGGVYVKYDSLGNWIKVTAKGTSAVPDSSPNAIAQSAKIASMHAKQNVANFMNNQFSSDVVTNISSKSKSQSTNEGTSVNDIETITIVTERMRDTSSAILRGLQVTSQTNDSNFVTVELTVTKQSITAATSLKTSMGN